MTRLYCSFVVEQIHNNELKIYVSLSNEEFNSKIYIIHLDLEQGYIFLMVMESWKFSCKNQSMKEIHSCFTSSGLCWIANVSGKLSICDGSSENHKNEKENSQPFQLIIIPAESDGIKKWILRSILVDWLFIIKIAKNFLDL